MNYSLNFLFKQLQFFLLFSLTFGFHVENDAMQCNYDLPCFEPLTLMLREKKLISAKKIKLNII